VHVLDRLLPVRTAALSASSSVGSVIRRGMSSCKATEARVVLENESRSTAGGQVLASSVSPLTHALMGRGRIPCMLKHSYSEDFLKHGVDSTPVHSVQRYNSHSSATETRDEACRSTTSHFSTTPRLLCMCLTACCRCERRAVGVVVRRIRDSTRNVVLQSDRSASRFGERKSIDGRRSSPRQLCKSIDTCTNGPWTYPMYAQAFLQ
jgi:hypothetical protein